jgi:hypothetical protein
MKKTIAVTLGLLAALFCQTLGAAAADDNTAAEILAIERKIMDGFQKGDLSPFLSAADPEITYIHAALNARVSGLTALKALVEPYRGQPLFDSYEIAEPRVQATGDIAVLSYVLVRHLASGDSRWNGTVVYRRGKEGWRVIHSHWSAGTA